MEKIGVLLFVTTFECDKVLNYKKKKGHEKKRSWWGNWGEESRRNEKGNQPTCVHVEGAIERPAAFVYETGNNNALPTTAAILSWIEVLFEGPWKIGEGTGDRRLCGVGSLDDDRIASFGWKWMESIMAICRHSREFIAVCRLRRRRGNSFFIRLYSRTNAHANCLP